MLLKFVGVCTLLGIVEGDIVWLNPRTSDGNVSLYGQKWKCDSYIVGGNEAKPHSHPYQAAILVEANNNVFFCGGSLISPNFVLTAATCVYGAKFVSIVLGAHDLKVEEPSQILVSGVYFVWHHAWDEKKNLNNIAVVKLSKSVALSAKVQVVKLPLPSGKDPTSAILSGWGKTSDSATEMSYKLQEVVLPVMSNDFCQQIMDDITPSHLCTSGKDKKGACKGDVGAPLVSYGTQYGIVSSIDSICQTNLPTVHTRVDKFLDWIYANTDVKQ